jgi:hypothetical protein
MRLTVYARYTDFALMSLRLNVAYGSWPCQNVREMGILAGLRGGRRFGTGYALMAAINGRTPMMLITLVML